MAAGAAGACFFAGAAAFGSGFAVGLTGLSRELACLNTFFAASFMTFGKTGLRAVFACLSSRSSTTWVTPLTRWAIPNAWALCSADEKWPFIQTAPSSTSRSTEKPLIAPLSCAWRSLLTISLAIASSSACARHGMTATRARNANPAIRCRMVPS